MRVDSYFNFPHYRRRNSLNECMERVKLNLSANKSFIKSTQSKLAACARRLPKRCCTRGKNSVQVAIIFGKKRAREREKERQGEREACIRDLHIRTRSLTDAYLFTGAATFRRSRARIIAKFSRTEQLAFPRRAFAENAIPHSNPRSLLHSCARKKCSPSRLALWRFSQLSLEISARRTFEARCFGCFHGELSANVLASCLILRGDLMNSRNGLFRCYRYSRNVRARTFGNLLANNSATRAMHRFRMRAFLANPAIDE